MADIADAETALDEPMPNIKEKVLRELAQLRSAASRLSNAISHASFAGNLLGFTEPALPQGYASGDPVPSSAGVMVSASQR